MVEELDYSIIHFDYNPEALPEGNEESGIIGQKRAIKALSLGLRTDRGGYNIFISGESGTGRLSAVRQEAEKCRHADGKVKDVCYAYNPASPNAPLCLITEKGKARGLKERMASLSEGDYKEKLNELSESYPENKDYFAQLSRYPFCEGFKHLNIVLDRTGEEKRPLIIDSHPSFEKLFGYYDKEAEYPQDGINLGSYARAAGGFLVLTAEELLAEKGLWDALKRHLDSTGMALSGRNVQGALGKDERVRPQPIPLNTKVILLGSDEIFDMLCDKDEQFMRLFKVAPQFDYRMEANEENIKGTIGYIIKAARKLGYEITKEAIAETLRYSNWFTESRETLTTQLSILGDLISEASLNAQTKSIGKEEILSAIENREYFTGISEDRINQEIREGDLIVSVSGSKTGIINGLAVMDRGIASFGTPAVISATVAPGSEGIVNIEHEAGLSGEIHDKGILILEGYLRKQYARTFPLSMYAGICFEQNYSEVDGDSASSSELYALLSAIGEIPVRQDIAVTGSVNQMGVLQPVGGINEKITGFWKTCRSSGLTGTQGVVIPKQNIKSLLLSPQIEEDIRRGAFHIWALSSIEEGMELLTGLKKGERDRKGNFTNGSFNRIIEDRLKALYEAGKGS